MMGQREFSRGLALVKAIIFWVRDRINVPSVRIAGSLWLITPKITLFLL